MIPRKFLFRFVIIFSLLISMLSGCGSDTPIQSSEEQNTSTFALPSAITQSKLIDTGSIRAFIQVDEDPRQEMTLSGSGDTASILLTDIPTGSHQFTLIIEYVLTSDPGTTVTLVQSIKTFTIETGSNDLSFTDADFDPSAFDDDEDGVSNLDEMLSGGTPPVVLTVSPADASTEVVASISIDATFDDPMLASTLTTANFTVTGANSGAINGTVSYDDISKTVSFTPSQALNEYETYTASLSTAVENTASLPLAATEIWSFTTGDNGTAPVVTTVFPVDGSTDIVNSTSITATFDDIMLESTLTTTNFNVTGAISGAVSGTVSYDATSRTVSFTPSLVLKGNDTFTATLSTAVQNTATLGLATATSWSFTIQEPPVQQVSAERTSGLATTPIIVYNNAGNGVAFWEVTSSGRVLVYSIYDGTTGLWSAETILASSESTTSFSPQIKTNGDSFVVAWIQRTNNIADLFASTFDGTNWSAPVIIDIQDTTVSSHQLVSSGTGYALTWRQSDGNKTRIYAAISNDGGSSWGIAVVIDNSTSSVSSPKIASTGLNTGSRYAVIWSQDNQRLGANVYTGTWGSGSAELIDNTALSNPTNYDITSNGDGYAVVYRKFDGVSINNIYSNVYFDPGTGFAWGTETIIDTQATNPSLSNRAITSNGTGYAVCLVQANPTINSVFAAVNPAGDNSWSATTLLETQTFNSRNCIIESNNTDYAVLWLQSDSSTFPVIQDLFSSVFTTSWSNASVIESNSDSISTSGYKLAGLGSRFVATWTQQLSGVERVFTNVYNNDWGLVEARDNGTADVNIPNLSLNANAGTLSLSWSQVGEGNFISDFDGIDWSLAQSLTTSAIGGSSFQPRLLSNNDGKVLALWTQDTGRSDRSLFANIQENGQWGTPQKLTDFVANSLYYAATDGIGFAVVWSQEQSIFGIINDGSSWGPVEELDDTSLENAELVDDQSKLVSPSGVLQMIESNGSGYMLIYGQFNGVTTDLYARRNDGAAWGTPVIIDSDTDIETPHSFNIATNGTTYLVSWKQRVGSFVNIYSNEFDGTNWGTPQPIENSDTTIEDFYDYVRVVSNGDSYLATWFQEIGPEFDRVNVNIYTAGSWGTPVNLDLDTSFFYKDGAPFAATNQNGDYAVAWRGLDSGSVVVNTYDGTTWNTSFVIDSGVSFSTTGTVNPLAGAGTEFAVIYTKAGDVNASVFDGTAWSVSEIIETGIPSVNFSNLNIASDGTGILAAWTQDDGFGLFDIVSNRFDTTTGWAGEIVLDQDANNSAFDLRLTGTTEGYFAGWTQAEPAGDPGVRYPWAKVGF